MRHFLFFLLMSLVFTLQAKDKPANFVIFLTDDQGWGDLGVQGHPLIKTPNLDQFAKEGVRLTQCYSACGVCSPSRSSILTGRTPYRNGVWRWIPAGHQVHLRTSEITIPEALKTKGYATCHTGKWHLNGFFNDPRHPQPNDHGYDWWLATQNNASPHHINPKNFVRNGQAVGVIEGASAVIASKEAVHWLRKERDKEKPFFITVWTHEPHLPIESAPEFMQPYADIDDEGIRQHHGNITQLDHAFGLLMKELDQQGLTEDTFVFFTSDNGPEGAGTKGRTRGSTGGLRGRKRWSHEGGIRVPGIARWPGHIKPGTTSSVPVIGSDLFSTVLAIAGVNLPKDRVIDGVDMRPALAGKPVERPVPLYWRNHLAPKDNHVALRVGDWKIVADESLQQFQLYEIEKDWREEKDLAEEMPDKLASMKAALLKVHGEVEKEGPSEWWLNEQPRQHGKRTKGKKLSEGKDETGDWEIVKGGTVSKDSKGYLLNALGGEAFALHKLDHPVGEKIAFELEYQAAVKERTRNACLVLGAEPLNDKLWKAGSMIGMGAHGIFPGSWANTSAGTLKRASLNPDASFKATVTIDTVKRLLTLKVDETEIVMQIPKDLEKIKYYGIYAKDTKTRFSPVAIE